MLNLFLAIFWFILGIGLIAYHSLTGDENYRLPGVFNLGRVSIGWLALLLVAYNLARWYAWKMAQNDRIARDLALATRERLGRHRDASTEPDPTFNFTDDPPPPNRRFTEQPPSNN